MRRITSTRLLVFVLWAFATIFIFSYLGFENEPDLLPSAFQPSLPPNKAQYNPSDSTSFIDIPQVLSKYHQDTQYYYDLTHFISSPLHHSLILPQADGNQTWLVSGIPPITQPARFSAFEFKAFSQNSEDSILLAIFLAIGVTNRRAVEACSGVGWENNVINLVINHGFDAIMIEGDSINSHKANNYISMLDPVSIKKPRWVNEFITADNFNRLIESQGFKGEIDLLSLDIDGIDYWLWDALTIVQPRVVVVEIQELWDWTYTYTRPYTSDFFAKSIPEMGASLLAFVHLAKSRGYRLVGCIRKGYNAFFVRNDLGVDVFGSDYPPVNCFAHFTPRWVKTIISRRRDAIKFNWVDPRRTTREKSKADAIYPKLPPSNYLLNPPFVLRK